MKLFKAAVGFLAIYTVLTAIAALFTTIFVESTPHSLNIAVTVIATVLVSRRMKVEFRQVRECITLCLMGGLAAGTHLGILSRVVGAISQLTPAEVVLSMLVNSAAVALTLFLSRPRTDKNIQHSTD
ncbi:hypothetical protein ACFSJ3_08970 [Corallincola platygyrae]|uniref:Uncharacterized protein n=1 Tax=Corallincola platygyrae TaxID=1193278 RepID=A0ABW4XKM9_9GAMM